MKIHFHSAPIVFRNSVFNSKVSEDIHKFRSAPNPTTSAIKLFTSSATIFHTLSRSYSIRGHFTLTACSYNTKSYYFKYNVQLVPNCFVASHSVPLSPTVQQPLTLCICPQLFDSHPLCAFVPNYSSATHSKHVSPTVRQSLTLCNCPQLFRHSLTLCL
jgi:hypothetical protein